MKFIEKIKDGASMFKSLWDFIRLRKKWFFAPIIIILFLFAVLIIIAESSALAPLIYTLF